MRKTKKKTGGQRGVRHLSTPGGADVGAGRNQILVCRCKPAGTAPRLPESVSKNEFVLFTNFILNCFFPPFRVKFLKIMDSAPGGLWLRLTHVQLPQLGVGAALGPQWVQVRDTASLVRCPAGLKHP